MVDFAKTINAKTPEEFRDRMVALGANPIETIKEVRRRFGLELEPARELVVTPHEIDVFLRANLERGVERVGAKRLLQHVYGCAGIDAIRLVDESGLWPISLSRGDRN
ncbi:hypothetical protein ABMA32_17495 [Mesorhizobium sp. VNQ89]|uniref:hypothetical protein n=1 Tax=Mesorhizobium quangtriensis TaxID=3157709 RepID=UPI0032B78BBD